MSNLREEEYEELTKLIYCDLSTLLQKIICTSYHYVGYDVPKESFELLEKYIQEYVNETKRVTNLTLDGQLATLKKIISEN